MKHKLGCLISICLFLWLAGIPVQAAEPDIYAEIETDAILEALPEEARALLDAGGFTPTELDPNGLQSFLFAAADNVLESINEPLRTGILLLILILLSRIVLEFAPDALRQTVDLCSTAIAGTVLLVPVAELIGLSEKIIQTLTALLAASVPVYASILALSGNALTGTTYGALTLTGGNLLCAACTYIFLPLTRIYLAFSAVAAATRFHLKQLTDMLYRVVKGLLVFAVTVFTGILSVQTLLSAQSDAATGKTLKFVASGTVPIVGGAFGDAFAVLSTSVSLMKSGVGAFGLLAVLAVFLPSVLQCTVWMWICMGASFAAELFEMQGLVTFLNGCAAAIRMLMAILFSTALVSMIAAGILLCVRSAYG